MKVYRIDVNFNDGAHWISPDHDDEAVLSLDLFTYQCESKKIPEGLSWYVDKPHKFDAGFHYISSSAFAFSENVYESDLLTHLEMAGQIIPQKLESGQDFYIMNITECVNMLDQERTEFEVFSDGRKRIKEYVFREKRIHESTLFKIPETMKFEMLTYSDVKDPEDEFYHMYHKLGFTGLKFEEIYSSK